MTTVELSKGICTEEELHRFEQGEIHASSEVLYHLSKRLGVPMNYFFEAGELTPNDYSKEIKSTIRHYIRKRDYETVLHMVNKKKIILCFKILFTHNFSYGTKPYVIIILEINLNKRFVNWKKPLRSRVRANSFIQRKRLLF